MPTCAVPTCSNISSRCAGLLKFHRFPKSSNELKRKWLQFCNNDSINVNTSRICSAHFTDSDYTEDMRARLLFDKIDKKLNPGGKFFRYILKVLLINVFTAIPSIRTYSKNRKTKSVSQKKSKKHKKESQSLELPIGEEVLNCFEIKWCESETSSETFEADPLTLSPILQIIKDEPSLDLYE